MDNIKLTVGLEPTDKYLKAKQDLLQAFSSFNELSLEQKRQLATELVGAQKAILLEKILIQYFG